jgi:hypothetical protein
MAPESALSLLAVPVHSIIPMAPQIISLQVRNNSGGAILLSGLERLSSFRIEVGNPSVLKFGLMGIFGVQADRLIA